MKTLLALSLVCLGGVAAIYAKTDGFTVVTTESARRADIAKAPRTLPDAVLLPQEGRPADFLEDLAQDGRLTVVNFIYTRCISICLSMGGELQQLQDALAEEGLDGRVRILSLSFDPHDTPERLARYAASMRADARLWRFAGIERESQRKALLDAFGIIVIPAPYGQFEHNAAYHIVTPDGRLARVLDIGDTDGLLVYVKAMLAKSKAEAASPAREAGSAASLQAGAGSSGWNDARAHDDIPPGAGANTVARAVAETGGGA
jgi:protein SCO1/2